MYIEKLEQELAPLREQLLTHDLYHRIESKEDILIFMESHVFAVWDFMSLLKALQRELTCTSVPWFPKGNRLVRRFINEIVIAEESDLNEANEPISHFEMYLDAMQALGANTSKIDTLIDALSTRPDYTDITDEMFPSDANKAFTDFTFEVIATNKPHLVASVFTFGREHLIPDMFNEIVRTLNKESNQDYKALIYYLDRHIEIDGGEHGPMSITMIEELCGNDPEKWNASLEIAKEALVRRISLWDSISDTITSRQKQS